jgi:glycerol-3-phosphate dehydrogenase (NAD(P)+)
VTPNNKVSVLGAGLWGTVLAQRLAEKGHPVGLWEFFPDLAKGLQTLRRHPRLPGVRLHEKIEATSDLEQAVKGARLVLIALPSQHVRHHAKHLKPILARVKPAPILVNASKGIEPETLKTMAEVVEDELPGTKGRVFAFSGPSFAREVARGVPTKILLAGPNGPLAREALKILDGHPLLVEHHPDRKGVELGGGLKNVLAIGCGVLDGMGAGANTKAVLITQGIQEIGRLVQKSGGKFETIYGLAGLGDLFATGTSHESRNRALGEKLGQGKDLQHAMREIQMVVEGVEAAKSAHLLSKAAKAKTPVIDAIWGIVHEGQPASRLLESVGFF